MTTSTSTQDEVRTPASTAGVRTRPTEDNKPESLTLFTPAMTRLRELSPLLDLQDDIEIQWKQLIVLAYLEGQRIVDVAWASGRRYNTARVYRILDKADINPAYIAPKITHPDRGLPLPVALTELPPMPDGLQHLLDTDPARDQHVEFPAPPRRSERSTEDNIPPGVVMTPILRRLYLLGRILNVLADLKADLDERTDLLLEIAVKENNPVVNIAWAWGRPAQRALVYRRLLDRGNTTERPSAAARVSEGKVTVNPLPVPDELLRLPGLANLDDALNEAA